MDPLLENQLREVFPQGDVELPDRSKYLTAEVDPMLGQFVVRMKRIRSVRCDWLSPLVNERVRRLVFVRKGAPRHVDWVFLSERRQKRWLKKHEGEYAAAFVDVSLVIPVHRISIHVWEVDRESGAVRVTCPPAPRAAMWQHFLRVAAEELEGLYITKMPEEYKTDRIPYVCILEKNRPTFSSMQQLTEALPMLIAAKLGVPTDELQMGAVVEVQAPAKSEIEPAPVADHEPPESEPATCEECLFWY